MSAADTSRKRKAPSTLSESSSEDDDKVAQQIASYSNSKVQKTGWNSDVKSNPIPGRDTTARQDNQERSYEANKDTITFNRYQPQSQRNDYYNDGGHHSYQPRGHAHGSRGPQNQYYDQGPSSSRDRYPSGSSSSSFYSQSEAQRNNHDRDSQSQYSRNNSSATSQQGGGTYRSTGEGLAPVVAQHYNQIEEKGLEAREESKIVILRKYNNWAKSMNFNDAMEELRKAGKRNNSLIGLDLCCGKGGDLRKWEKSRMMKHVVFVDIAEVSLNNCKERYEDMKRRHDEQRERRGGRGPPLFTAEFFVADCTRESVKSKMVDPDMKFDLVSCQFSFHYCFESAPQAQQMLRNATENLVSGGYFIGSLPNADRIVKRRRQCKQAEFGNEVYKIRFECNEPYPVYGARYFFELEEAICCPEFLVHFPTLTKLATEFGLELIYRHAFDKFHKIHVERQDAKQLLNGMGALETFPAQPGEDLHFNQEHYDHAREYIDRVSDRYSDREVKVGTISSVEWEAIRLYSAFCFRKK